MPQLPALSGTTLGHVFYMDSQCPHSGNWLNDVLSHFPHSPY